MFNNYTYSNNNNQEIRINACSGGIYKTYKNSWFERFDLKSPLADNILFQKDAYYNQERNNYKAYKDNEDYKKVQILQMVICGENSVIAEMILTEDLENSLKIEKGAYEN